MEQLRICDPLHQQILIDNLPCGIETFRKAWEDRTSLERS